MSLHANKWLLLVAVATLMLGTYAAAQTEPAAEDTAVVPSPAENAESPAEERPLAPEPSPPVLLYDPELPPEAHPGIEKRQRTTGESERAAQSEEDFLADLKVGQFVRYDDHGLTAYTKVLPEFASTMATIKEIGPHFIRLESARSRTVIRVSSLKRITVFKGEFPPPRVSGGRSNANGSSQDGS